MKIEAKIDRLVQKGNLMAIASVSLDGMFVVKGLKVMNGKKGLFVSMPQESYADKDGKMKYSNLFFGQTNAARDDLNSAVLDAYRMRMDPNYVPEKSHGQAYAQQGNFQRSYEPQYPCYQHREPQYPEWVGDYDDMLPMELR